ncbi:MAG: hypothetical protein LRY76_08275 [Alphaproteobacteria bacterium]|nr:hypothetical protein [Alphaproteobacteria bacterium]
MVKHQETGQDGSFIAWGVCFFYAYSAPGHELNISTQEGEKPLISLAVGKRIHRKILSFIQYFEKAAQIKALMLSNGETINITQTMDHRRLRGIANTLFDHALFALDLGAGKKRRLTATLAHIYDLKHFSIRHFTCSKSSTAYYRASLKTHSGNELVGRSLTLHGLLMTVSEKIISELIALEFSSRNNSAQNLLSVSAKLLTLSRILNDGFYPAMKIRKPKTAGTAGITSLSKIFAII